MEIFTSIKELVSARQAAEFYGIKVNRNGMACCPFHDDHTPSMKADENYYCFGCGARGDAIDFTARLFGLSQIDAAKRLIEDMRLPVTVNSKKKLKARPEPLGDRMIPRRRLHERFHTWCCSAVTQLKEYEGILRAIGDDIPVSEGAESDLRKKYIRLEQKVSYYLDVLCLGYLEDQQEFFLKDREEVENLGREIKHLRAEMA